MTDGAERLAEWLGALAAGASPDTLDASDPNHRRFLDRHRATLARGDARWPAERILLQLALESDDDARVEAALGWLDTHDPMPAVALRLDRAAPPTTRWRTFGGRPPLSAACRGPDGALFTGGPDRALRRWDAETGRLTGVGEAHRAGLLGVACLGPYIASWDTLGELLVWRIDGPAFEPAARFPRGTAPHGLYPIGDGLAVLRDAIGLARLSWSPAITCETLPMPIAADADALAPRPFAIGPGGLLATACDGRLVVLDPRADGPPKTGAIGDAEPAAVAACGADLATWGESGTLRLWALETEGPRCVATHAGAAAYGLPLADGSLMTWSPSGEAGLWLDRARVAEPGRTDAPIMAGCAVGRGALTIDRVGRVCAWSADGVRALGYTALERWATWAPGRALAWSTASPTLEIWRADGLLDTIEHDGRLQAVQAEVPDTCSTVAEDRTVRLVERMPAGGGRGGGPAVTAHAAAGDIWWLGDGEGWLSTLDLASGARTRRFRAHNSAVAGVIAPSADRVASWAVGGRLRLWTTDGRLIAEGPDQSASFAGHLAQGGRRVAWGVDDRGAEPRPFVRWWSDAPGEQPQTVALPATPRAVAAVGEDHLLAWGAHALTLWRAGAARLSAAPGDALVDAAALIGADDPLILTAHASGSVRRWSPEGPKAGEIVGHIAGARRIVTSLDGGAASIVGADGVAVYRAGGGWRSHPLDAPVTDCAPLDGAWAVATTTAVQRLDAHRSEAAWVQPAPPHSRRRIALAGGESGALCVTEGARVLCLDPASGALRSGWQGSADVRPLPVAHPGRAVLETRAGRLIVLEI